MSVAPATKKSQGTLVEEALVQYGSIDSVDLIDIGINLADPSFDEACTRGSLRYSDYFLSYVLFCMRACVFQTLVGVMWRQVNAKASLAPSIEGAPLEVMVSV